MTESDNGLQRRRTGCDRDRPLQLHASTVKPPDQGFAGDTLASALLANGVTPDRPQLQVPPPARHQTAGPEEPATPWSRSARRRESEPNMPGHRAALARGAGRSLAASIAGPTVPGYDVGQVNDLLSRLLPAGFYYKTFMWPHWHWFEPFDPPGRRAGPRAHHELRHEDLVYESRFRSLRRAGGGRRAGRAAWPTLSCGGGQRRPGAPGGRRSPIPAAGCWLRPARGIDGDDRPLEWVAKTVAELDRHCPR